MIGGHVICTHMYDSICGCCVFWFVLQYSVYSDLFQSDKPCMWVLFTCCGDVDFDICLFISFCVHIVMLDVRVLLVLVRLLSMLCIAA